MLEYLGLENEAVAVEHAVQEAVASGQGTKEIGGSLGTRETGDCIVEIIRNR
jgi:3-isopropylmalate dehydrogenase